MSDSGADPSYSNLGYKNGETDDPIENGFFEAEPPEAESVWDGTVLQPTVLVSVDGIYYYKIYTGKELAYIAQTGGKWLGYNYMLANDIVLNNVELTYDTNGNLTADATKLNVWTPIDGFKGVFDGNGFSVSGVYVNGASYSGFFGKCYGNVFNLTLTNSYIKGTNYVGGICGHFTEVSKDMVNCYFDGAVVGTGGVGGLVGYARTITVSRCGNYGDVWGTGSHVAGIAGEFYSYGINNCFNEGNIYSKGDCVGGIAGSTDLYGFTGCVNRGNVTGKNYVGGVCGKFIEADISNCGNTGNIKGTKYVGGICGYSTYDTAEYTTADINSSYNTGEVTGESCVGGITGYADFANVNNCYSVGNVTGTTETGAVIGTSESIWGRGEVKNCYYFKDNTTNTNLTGFGNAPDVEGVVEAKEIDFFCINTDRTLNMGGHEYDSDNACDKDCNNCGIERVIQHSFTIVTYPIESTCSATGEKHKECSICGEIEIEVTPARGHYVSVPGKEFVDSYTISNDETSPFVLSDGWYSSTNKSHSSISVLEINATYDCTMVFKYKVSSEKNYDKLIILKNGTNIDTISGNVSEKSYTLDLIAGDKLYVKYSKDGSASNGEDTGYFKIDSCTQTEIDTTVYVPADDVEPTCENAVVCESCNQIIKNAIGHSFTADFTWDESHESCTAKISCANNCSTQISLDCDVLSDNSNNSNTVHTATVIYNDEKFSNSLICNNYLVTFVDWNGMTISSQYYHHGNEIVIPEATEKTGYSFANWTPEVPDVMPRNDLTFTAVYSPNSYDAVFNANGGAWSDGATEKTVSAEYGAEIVAPENPVRPGYIFSKWTPEVGVMDDVNGKTFTAEWIASTETVYTVETYTMNTAGEYEKTVQTLNGTTDSTVNAEYNIKEGFTFNSEKSVIIGVVSADNSLVLKVYIDRNIYSFTTNIDGVCESENYYYGSIIPEIIPEKTGYSFVGWDKIVPSTMPAEDLTITAEFEANNYDAVFNANGGAWADGATEKTVVTAFDSEIIAPENPVKQGYIFSKWTPEVEKMDDVNGKTFKAEWLASTETVYAVETYTMNLDGEYVKTVQNFTGATDSVVNAEYSIKEGFAFNEEKSVISGVVAADNSLVLKVYIDRNQYTFKTVLDGVSTETKYYYDAEITVPDTPVKTGYTFVKWDNVVPAKMPANDVTITAVFSANNYDAVFNANGGAWADGSTEKTVVTAFDSEIISPENPAKQGYIFSRWTPEVGKMDDVNGKTFTAEWISSTETVYTVETYTMNTSGEYEKTVNTYAGRTDSTVNAEYTVKDGFTFNEEKSVISGVVAADNSLVLKVYYDRNKYTFTTIVDGVEYFAEYYYDAEVTAPQTPSKTGYTFVKWDNAVPSKMPAKDVTVNAVWKLNSYNVKWIVDGKVVKNENVNYGSGISAPTAPVKTGYVFKGWTPEVPATMPDNDLTFTAVYEATGPVSQDVVNKPSQTTISYGDAIILHVDASMIPAGGRVEWTASNNNFSYKANGATCEIHPEKSGDTTFTATIYDANGNPVSTDEQTMTSKAGFFDKIIAFFKGLFGLSKTYPNVFKGIF